MGSYTPNKVLRVLASAGENAVVEYCGGRSIIDQIVTYPEETSPERHAFLILFKKSSSAQAALQRSPLTGLGGRPVIINTVADTSIIHNRFKNKRNSIMTMQEPKSFRSAASQVISAHILPVIEKENRAEAPKSPLRLPYSLEPEAQYPRPFSSTYTLPKKFNGNISISSEVALSPTFRRSLIDNENAPKVRQAFSKPSLKIKTGNSSPARPSTTMSPSSTGTPSRYGWSPSARRRTLDSPRPRSGFSGSDTAFVGRGAHARPRPRKTSIFGSNAVRFEGTPAVKSPRQECSIQFQNANSSPAPLVSAKKALVMAELAESKQRYCDALLALKTKILEIETNELQRNAIPSVRVHSIEV